MNAVDIVLAILWWGGILFNVAVVTLASLHAAQWVERREDRLLWILGFVFFPLAGNLWYFLTKYQRFREVGKGGLLFDDSQDFRWREYFELTEAEKAGAPSSLPQEKVLPPA